MIDNYAYQKTITEIMMRIEKKPSQKINIKKISEAENFSQEDIENVFVSFAKESVQQFQERMQIQQALIDFFLNHCDINTAATRAGFSHTKAFMDATLARLQVNPIDLIHRQNQHGDILGGYRSVRPNKKHEQCIELLDKNTLIEEINETQIQFVRHVGDYSNTYKAWLNLNYQLLKSKNIDIKHDKIGVIYDYPNLTPSHLCRYDAAIITKKSVCTLSKKNLTGGLYAVYRNKEHTMNLTDIIHMLLCVWLPSKGYKVKAHPIYLRYPNMGHTAFAYNKLDTNIFIPIEQKKQ